MRCWLYSLQVRSSATAELQGSVAETWQGLLPESWIQLQFTECYGLPWPLELQAVQGTRVTGDHVGLGTISEAEDVSKSRCLVFAGDLQEELVGEIAIFGQVVRRFRWQAIRFANSD